MVPVIFLGFASVVVACDHWPGVSKDGDPESPGDPVFGTCSGTPLPCGSLSGADCNKNAGCKDFGSCTGTPSESGPACGAELSYEGCAGILGIPGCFWAPNCKGTPYGQCSGVTESSCLVAKGCVFTAAGDGGPGGAPTCDSFQARCTSNAECGCGFSCVAQCATCRAACGIPCLSDFDCAGTSDGAGTFTPFCVGASAASMVPYTGSCAVTR